MRGNNYDPFWDENFGNFEKNYNDTFCRFGALGLVKAKVINSTKVLCTSPPSYVLREVPVEVMIIYPRMNMIL